MAVQKILFAQWNSSQTEDKKLVSITKWVIIGAGLIMLGLFTKEAATTSLTGTLQRTGMAGGSIGSALSGVGGGIADLMRGLFTPLWEVGNFAKSFGMGSDFWGNSTPDPQASTQRIDLTGQGGGFADAETQGGGDPGFNTDPIENIPYQNMPESIQGFTFSSRPHIASYPTTPAVVDWGTTSATLPLGAEAINWYRNLGVSVSPPTPVSVEDTGGGSNNTTGMGASSGSNNPLSRAHAAGYSLGSA